MTGMNTGVVSRRYAKALLAYAKAAGVEDKVYKEAQTLSARFIEVPGLRHAIENPVLDSGAKLGLLREAAGGKTVSSEMSRFLSLVLEERREKFLQFMMWSYIDLYRDDKNIIIGSLTTAVPAPKLAKRLADSVSKRSKGNVIIETKIDPALLGGYVFELEGRRLDASVANQLKRVKQQFIAKNRRIV